MFSTMRNISTTYRCSLRLSFSPSRVLPRGPALSGFGHLSVLLCLFALFSVSEMRAAAETGPPKARTHLPSNSIAMSDDALATFFNPSGLAAGRRLNLYYLRTYQNDLAGDDAFFLAVPGAGFGMEFGAADAETDFTRYTLSGGRHLGNLLYWGTSYSWMRSDHTDYDRFRSISMGLMYRRRYLSIGATARDLNRPTLLGQKLGRTYDLGLAFRPGTWRTTFSLDMQKTQGRDGIDLRYALEIRPIREVMFRGTLKDDLSFDVRFGINIGNWGIGTGNAFDKDRVLQTGVGYFHFSNAPKTEPLRRRRVFLDVPMHALNRVVPIAKWDADVSGVLVRINGDRYGLAQLQEMADAILDFRESGRIVLCYLSHCATGDYIVAATTDGILSHPTADLRVIGIRTERTFYKAGLDILGIRADLEHIGEYKSAAEPYTRYQMSEAHREVQNIILDDLYEQIVSAIAAGRGWTHEAVRNRVDAGPYTAQQALTAALVDRLVYEDELQGVVTELTDTKTDLVPLSAYAKGALYARDWHVPQPKVAIVRAEGLMLTGDSFVEPFLGTRIMGADTLSRIVKAVKEDATIKAVVLRIDSGGGLVVAADKIWRELIQLKQVKPLVVSMGNVAASGGYYIASPAHTIVAEPGTITGSIGVVGGKYSFKGFYQRFGMRKEILKRGEHADFYSDYGDYPPDEKAIVQKQLQEIYDDFVEKVAFGRENLTVEEVERLARGRIWSGRQAQENGLVDELGGLDHALAIAQQQAGLEKKSVEVVEFPKRTWMSQLVGNIRFPFGTVDVPMNRPTGAGASAGTLPETLTTIGLNLAAAAETADTADIVRLLKAFRNHRYLLLMPYQVYVND